MVKAEAELLHSVVLVRAVLPFEGIFGRNVQKERDIGHKVFERNAVYTLYELHIQSARIALVGERGIHKPVAQYKRALRKRGRNLFREVLGARRRIKERLALIGHGGVFAA